MCGVSSSEFPLLTAKNVEISLASDDLLAHYFNDFLSLPSFPEGLLYNPETRLFEVATDEAEFVSRRIRSVLRCSKSQLLTGDSADLCRSSVMDNHYSVTCLDREQGIQWIIKERLPLFLLSDCYSEYRLAKLFQQEFKVFIQRMKLRGRSTQYKPQMQNSSEVNEGNIDTLQRLQTCSKSAEDLSGGRGGSRRKDLTCLTSEPKGRNNSVNRVFSSSPQLDTPSSDSPDRSYEGAQEPRSSPTLPSDGDSGEQHRKESSNHGNVSCEPQHECLVSTLGSQVFNNAGTVMECRNGTNIPADVSRSAEQTDCSGAPGLCDCQAADAGCRETPGRREGKVQGDTGGVRVEERTLEARSGGPGQKNVPYNCSYGICCHGSRLGLDDFKEFLHGRPGEKTFNLWMDIERLKSVQKRERKNRYLALMRGWYLLSSSRSCFPAALLSPLGLNTSPSWTEEKLCSVQPVLTESLLAYWAPRFWMSQHVHGNFNQSPHGTFLKDQYTFALSAPEAFRESLVCWDTPQLHPKLTTHTQLPSGRGPRRSSVEAMLEALNADWCAGSYFTTFCEQSGNQLWENAAHFWADLQNYRELFYQDGLDPYRVQREAQLLYSTYLLSSARRTIGVDEGTSWEVHHRIMPAFEELFDEVEEHALNVLLEPWTLLLHQDVESFQKVCVWEDVRSVNSQEYQERHRLCEDSQLQLKQLKGCQPSGSPPPPSSVGPLLSDFWSSVPPGYRGYRLGSLFRHRHEINHFKSFLEDQGASIHLSCWLDLEQYRRTSQKEQWSQMANKYLNSNYFFGPESPATTQQQDDILRLAGGLEHLKLEAPSQPVVVEMQDIIKSQIEKVWLPQFLSTAEFLERRKHQPKIQAADGLSRRLYRRRRARRAAWKAEGLWMSSSKEILLFRRVLLNPVTCLQFQHFVYLKGGFLENDVLFWQEVQRYKDLCHSHSDEATVQHKISIIISCFINSSIPPALQVDVPPEQAQRILEKRRELGPYVFREAQISVFNQLLKFWPEFQELRNSTQEERLLPLLQEKRIKHAARLRRRRRKEEEEEEEVKRAQEELKRPQSASREEEETGDEEGRSEERQLKTQGGEASPTPIKSLSWSYSKYMAALKKEEVLLKKQMEGSFSTASDSSSDDSVPSASSRGSPAQSSWRPVDHKKDRGNRGARIRLK